MKKVIQYMNKHYELYPLAACIGFGMGLAGWYITRLATKSPDVAWFRATNPTPWVNIPHNHRVKLYSNCDHSKMSDPIPPEARAALEEA